MKINKEKYREDMFSGIFSKDKLALMSMDL